jgi:two-component system, chemotaxis family, chemotaxis protein CheY
MSINENVMMQKLPSVLDLKAAEGLLDMLRANIKDSHPLHLDASEVETLTFSCAQVLLVAINSHALVAIDRPSAEFAAAFGDLGFAWREPATESITPLAVGDASVPVETANAEQMPESGSAPGSGLDLEPVASIEPMQIADPDPEPVATSNPDPVAAIIPQQMDSAAMAKRILTIDDSRTIRDMLRVTLTEAGYDVIQGVDGVDGLGVLGDEPVDLVITDINMPKMDGYEVIRQLRSNAKHKSTPILVLTTESDASKRNIAREAGATGWIVKPFDPDRLIATVRKVAQ